MKPPVVDDDGDSDDDFKCERERVGIVERRRRFEEALRSEANKGFLDRHQDDEDEVEDEEEEESCDEPCCYDDDDGDGDSSP